MRRHVPDPRQGLFRWVWSDPEDDRPDDDEPTPAPPPLTERIRQRQRLRTPTLSGTPITSAETPGRP